MGFESEIVACLVNDTLDDIQSNTRFSFIILSSYHLHEDEYHFLQDIFFLFIFIFFCPADKIVSARVDGVGAILTTMIIIGGKQL